MRICFLEISTVMMSESHIFVLHNTVPKIAKVFQTAVVEALKRKQNKWYLAKQDVLQ